MKFSVITSAYNQLHLLKKAKPYWDGQSLLSFEWIIADDGSLDGTAQWAQDNVSIYVRQEHEGYRLTRILNLAAKQACGDYLVWVMGDSYPDKDFLQELDKVVAPNRMVNGIRVNVDENDKIVSPDWRINKGENWFDVSGDVVHVEFERPWELMTLNSMVLPRKAYKKLGGLFKGYDEGYGRMDWDLAANAFYNDYDLVWAMNAIVYHLDHKGRKDTSSNTKTFERRLNEFRGNN